MENLKYSEVLQLNKEIGKKLKSNPYKITVLSNIIVHQFKEILEFSLRTEGINANVVNGDYDNIVQDSLKYKESNTVIIFWELSNIIDGLHYKIELFNDEQLTAIFDKTKLEIDLVLKNVRNTSLVLFNKFTSLPFSNSLITNTNLEEIADQLNQYLQDSTPANVKLVELEKVFSSLGVDSCLDFRYFYSSKALYTIGFFKEFAEMIKPYILSANGKAKKVLIFDCDNTLWKGILGEDGFDKIEMSPKTKDGAIFAEIQSMALALNRHGVLICLCSKNNPKDVDKVIKSHPDMQLKDKHITINKSNWSDKVTNLTEIAQELNIGIDSFVFVDDSHFEVNFIKAQLPEITVLQVPKRLYEYPKMLRENLGLFYNLSFTAEDEMKIEMYNQQMKREIVKKEFTDIEDYLASLELTITIFQDEESIIPRMAQMSQKTNQFNLTSNRYTEGDIKNFIENDSATVLAFSVSDKFGDSGITGLCIINLDQQNQIAEIDTFLMSCRVIGRNIEYAFIDYLIDEMKVTNIKILNAKYIQTQKNEQVKTFYDNCSFGLVESDDSIREYSLEISNYNPSKINFIEVVNGK
jgi:FkbH-like protein